MNRAEAYNDTFEVFIYPDSSNILQNTPIDEFDAGTFWRLELAAVQDEGTWGNRTWAPDEHR